MMEAANPIAASVEEEPGISAVIPAYNAAHFLQRSLEPLIVMARRGLTALRQPSGARRLP